jgi:predicted nucleotidyltransferase
MKTTDECIVLLRDYKRECSDKYGIKRIGIFGSVARGEQTEDSDVDICVETQTPCAFNLVHIKDDLQQLFYCKVDIVRLRDTMDSFLLGQINKDAIYV